MDAQHHALYAAVFLQVVYHLVHDRSRDGKTVTCIRTGLGIEHGVDTYQFALGVDQCTARVACVDGSIGLDEALYAVSTQRTCLGRDDTCGNGVVQSEWVAHCDDPFTHLHVVAVGDRKGRQVLAVNLDQGKVGGLVGTDDAC